MIDYNRRVWIGDVMEQLKNFEDESIDVTVFSPSFWGLRNYNVEGQWGFERSYKDYLFKLKMLMREIRRILKPTGSCWVNLGDTYASQGGPTRHFGWSDPKHPNGRAGNFVEPASFDQGIIPKSRIGIPERFYIQEIDDITYSRDKDDIIDYRWIARNHIPWVKPNAMPSSVKDRLTCSWESLFFFTKSKKYFFDQTPIRERAITDEHRGHGITRARDIGYDSKYKGHQTASGLKQDEVVDPRTNKPKQTYKGFNARYKPNYETRSPRDVWTINTKPFLGAHFATFPVELVLRILKCSCPKNGIVLDPFFGAGTTGLAAEMLGLRWCGIELNEKYVHIANNRIKKYMEIRNGKT